jgi:hypothetical protein
MAEHFYTHTKRHSEDRRRVGKRKERHERDTHRKRQTRERELDKQRKIPTL